MKHKDMSYGQRQKLHDTFYKDGICKIEVFTEEPYIKLQDGTLIYFDVVCSPKVEPTKKCKLCKKPVDPEEWDNFSGMHSKCENESYDILDKEVEE